MPKLRATAYMTRLVRADEPKITQNSSETEVVYRYKAYMRCCIQNGIFKVAIFFPEEISAGNILPTYVIYVDREKEQYLTYCQKTDRWITGSLYYSNMGYYLWHSKMWCTKETNKMISNYFNNHRSGIEAVATFQNRILEKKLEQRHREQTDPWDEDLKQTRPLPKDWEEWVSQVGIPQHFIFYHYSRKKENQTGYCTHCKKKVSIEEPKYNKEGKCSHCGAQIIYKSIGMCKTAETEYYRVHLMQRCEDGVMLREFTVKRIHRYTDFKKPAVYIHEAKRIICDKQGYPKRAYYFGRYKDYTYRWIRTGTCSVNNSCGYYVSSYEGKVYGKTIPDLAKKELKKTGFLEYYKKKGQADPEEFLVGISRHPYLEKLAKVGLTRLFDECVRLYLFYNEIAIDNTQESVLKMLNLHSQQLKKLRECNGGQKYLHWLQYEKNRGRQIAEETMKWLCENNFTIKEFTFLKNKMSVEQIHHYVVRQMQENDMKLRETLTTWSDYLAMAQRLGMDTNDEIIYKVRKLRQRHDELVEICNSKNDAVRAKELLDKYPNIEQVLESIKEKYEYSDEKYSVIVPKRIENIFLEARNLKHCAGNEKYLERIATNESYVMFLRKTNEPDKAHYTLEVEPGGTIRQKRTMFDRQGKDIEEATEFLHKWQKEISMHMTVEDHKLAKKSKRLRLKEFAEMDKNNLLINTGHLQGQRLVDVLMADLMEAA